jgi:hypothetical protein
MFADLSCVHFAKNLQFQFSRLLVGGIDFGWYRRWVLKSSTRTSSFLPGSTTRSSPKSSQWSRTNGLHEIRIPGTHLSFVDAPFVAADLMLTQDRLEKYETPFRLCAGRLWWVCPHHFGTSTVMEQKHCISWLASLPLRVSKQYIRVPIFHWFGWAAAIVN